MAPAKAKGQAMIRNFLNKEKSNDNSNFNLKYDLYIKETYTTFKNDGIVYAKMSQYKGSLLNKANVPMIKVRICEKTMPTDSKNKFCLDRKKE